MQLPYLLTRSGLESRHAAIAPSGEEFRLDPHLQAVMDVRLMKCGQGENSVKHTIGAVDRDTAMRSSTAVRAPEIVKRLSFRGLDDA
jgi:hypothetical protein